MALLIGDSFDLTEFGFGLPTDSTLLSTFGHHEGGAVDSNLILNHVGIAQAQIVEQFESAEKFRDLVRGFVQRVQDQEYLFSDLQILTTLDFATADTLDSIGGMIGLPRSIVSAATDDDYRALIKIQISINRSSATAKALIDAIKLLTDSANITYLEIYPAGIYIAVLENGISSAVKAKIKELVAGGVGLEIVFIDSIAPPFTFASEGGVPVQGLGFNEFDYTESGDEVGGSLVELT
jgi:hypothetical protein